MQLGSYDRMIDNAVRFHTGYIQIHNQGYWEDQQVNDAFVDDVKMIEDVNNVEYVDVVVPRLESFVLASEEDKSRGALLIGINPELEDQLSNLESKIIEGRYIQSDDKGVIVSTGLMDYLELSIGDTLVMIGQGYHGVNSAGKYPILGSVKIASPDLNSRLVYLPLKEAQWFFGAEGMLTSLALVIPSTKVMGQVVDELKHVVNIDDFEVMDWTEMMPSLVQQMEMDVVSGYIIIGILYAIIGFGIFGTVIMMVEERKYEMGVLLSIGMRRKVLNKIMALESIFMTMIGVMAGLVLSFPLALYFHVNPIRFTGKEYVEAFDKLGVEPVMPFSIDSSIFLSQVVVVLVLAICISIYPVIKVNNIKPVEAMRK
ncbi:MAG: ABC transporter permease [Flavobacteriales bacterium]|nr:ABC transporter permease [Flavobacteriales bacterium]